MSQHAGVLCFASARSEVSCLYLSCSSSSRCSWACQPGLSGLLACWQGLRLSLGKRPEARELLHRPCKPYQSLLVDIPEHHERSARDIVAPVQRDAMNLAGEVASR